jgi:ferrous iron transport protein B
MALAAAKERTQGERPHVFSGSVEHAIAHIEESIEDRVERPLLRWYAVKLFERDSKVQEELNLDASLKAHIETHIRDCEKELDDDAESIVTNQRYAYISRVVERSLKRKHASVKLSASDRIDRIVTNRILALPIFAIVMFLVYYIAVTTVGTILTDFTNDTLFGGWIMGNLGAWLESANVAPWLVGLIVDGIVGASAREIGCTQMTCFFSCWHCWRRGYMRASRSFGSHFRSSDSREIVHSNADRLRVLDSRHHGQPNH